MNKKSKSVVAVLALTTAFSATSFTACGSKDEIIKDGKTVNVRVCRMGYGDEFAYELKERFEETFANEGYKLNILEPSTDMRGNVALTELADGYDTTGVDLYISGGLTAEQVGVNGDYGVVVEDLTELVYNQKPIGYDGKEETQTIAQKLDPEVISYAKDSTGKMYNFMYAQSSAGLVVNTRKLAKYGLELPRTTNEMFDCFDKIYRGTNGVGNSTSTSTYPVTYVSGTNGYALCAFLTMFAQYDIDEYNRFWSMEEKVDGVATPMRENGYEVYKSDAVLSMLTNAYRGMDVRAAAPGSTTQTLDQSQAKIMVDGKNNAVFMFNGDWMLNEVALNFEDEVDDIEFINTPVNSDLGLRLFGAGTSYNLSAEKADDVLSLIAKCVDERKTIEQIISTVSSTLDVTLDSVDAQTAANARGLVYNRGVESACWINKGSEVKDIAALVLRMMASEDFAGSFARYANSATPYGSFESMKNDYKFVQQALEIASNPYMKNIKGRPTGFRSELGLTNALAGINHIPSKITSGTITSIYDGKGGLTNGVDVSVYKTAATAMMNDAYDNAVENWSEWLDRLN